MFSKRASGKAVLIADIDDAGVAVAIFLSLKGTVPHILVCERKTLPLEERSSDQKDVAILSLLDETLDNVLKTYAKSDSAHPPAPPYAAHIFIRGDRSRVRTAEAREQYTNPRSITKDLLKELVRKAVSTASENAQDEKIASVLLQAFVNGYPTAQPLGKKGTSLSIVALEAYVQVALVSGIRNTLGKHVPGRAVQIHSSIHATIVVLREQLRTVNEYLILDIGGDSTSCAVVRDEVITQTGRIAEGRSALIRRLTGGGLPEETASQLRMLAADVCATEACRALKDSLARMEPELVKVFGDAFTPMVAERRFPNTMLLIASSEFAPWLSSFFSRIDFAPFTITQQPFRIESLTPDHTRDLVEWKSGTPADIGSTIAAAAVHMLDENQ